MLEQYDSYNIFKLKNLIDRSVSGNDLEYLKN